jgi:hypothetical protein
LADDDDFLASSSALLRSDSTGRSGARRKLLGDVRIGNLSPLPTENSSGAEFGRRTTA